MPSFRPDDTMCFFSLNAMLDNVIVHALAIQLDWPGCQHISTSGLEVVLSLARIHTSAWFAGCQYRLSKILSRYIRDYSLRVSKMTTTASYQTMLWSTSTTGFNDQHQSTPPTSNEEQLIGPSRAHFQKSYYEIKPLAAGSYGETYLAIRKDVATSIRSDGDKLTSQQTLFNALRESTVVAKIPKGGRGVDELAKDIDFLAHALPVSELARPPLTTMLDCNKLEDSMWLTLGFARGGELYNFARRNKSDLTLGLRWHIGLKMAEAIAYLHYGETDLISTVEHPEDKCWPLVYHGDFHTGNLLLTSSAEGSFRDYPDLQLADFGKARQRVPPSSARRGASVTHEPVAAAKQRQRTDFRSAGLILLGTTLAYHHRSGPLCSREIHCQSRCGRCPRADCEDCTSIGKRVGKLEGLGEEEKALVSAAEALRNFCGETKEEALDCLRNFAKEAMEGREKAYKPLSAEAREMLDAVKVSDEEIDRALGLGIFPTRE